MLRKAARQLLNSRRNNYFLSHPFSKGNKICSDYCHRCGSEKGSSRPLSFFGNPEEKWENVELLQRAWGWALGNTLFVEISVSFPVKCLRYRTISACLFACLFDSATGKSKQNPDPNAGAAVKNLQRKWGVTWTVSFCSIKDQSSD